MAIERNSVEAQSGLSGPSGDPRPVRTRAAIFAAVERLSEASSNDVTVAGIAREAGISRSGFYTQFSGLEELISAMVSQAAEQFGAIARQGAGDDPGGNRRSLARASLSRLVEHVNSHLAFYHAAMSWKVSLSVHDATIATYAAQIRKLIDAVTELAGADDRLPKQGEVELVSQFIAGGLSTAITAWLRSHQATPVPEFIDQLLALLPEWLTSEPLMV